MVQRFNGLIEEIKMLKTEEEGVWFWAGDTEEMVFLSAQSAPVPQCLSEQ